MIVEGKVRADAIRDDIKSGKYSFRHLSRKYGVSVPYISACARRMGLSRNGVPIKRTSSGFRPMPILTNVPTLGVKKNH